METGEGSAASTEQQESAQNPSAEQDLQNTLSLKRSPRKRKRRHSDETIPSKAHGNKLGYRPANKKSKLHSQLFAMSSTKAANNVMKFRLGGSVSDPLNLSGAVDLGDDCSTCAPSPVNADVFGQPSPLPPQLQHDPLNLEGKVKNFPANKHGLANKHLLGGLSHGHSKIAHGHKKKPHSRRRTISKTEGDKVETKEEEKRIGKESRYCYGNYDRYYGYRNTGVDLRLSLLKKEWFEGKDCLDIGCNTGQVTIKIAREMKPRKMVGVDIDSKLITMAWKNLHRGYIPAVAPDGRPFPLSLGLTRGPISIPCVSTAATTTAETTNPEDTSQLDGQSKTVEVKQFPHNVHFVESNYVPQSDASQDPEYDVILALSVSKWIHLNWGDVGIKRFFKRVYGHLRPGGMFIVEPQPHSSYTKKKKLTSTIYANFQSIQFYPRHFHDYLMSEEVGFAHHKFLGVPENKSKGFRRPLHMYIKADKCLGTIANSQTDINLVDRTTLPSASSSDTDEGLTTSKQLKSVVVEPQKRTACKNGETDQVSDPAVHPTCMTSSLKGGTEDKERTV